MNDGGQALGEGAEGYVLALPDLGRGRDEGQAEAGHNQVDEFNANERNDEPSYAVDEHILAQRLGRANRLIGDAL